MNRIYLIRQTLVAFIATCGIAAITSSLDSPHASAQIVTPSLPSGSSTIDLNDRLINRLRATTPERQAFVRRVTQLTQQRRLDIGLVLAFEKYAIRRNPNLPFPYFAAALRFEARRRGIVLPPVQFFRSDITPPGR